MALTAKQKRDQRDQELRDEGAAAALAKLQDKLGAEADIRGPVSPAVAATNFQAAMHPDQVAAASGLVARPQHAGDKVIVGCKAGVAYLNIQLCRIDEKFEQNLQGGRTIKEATRIGEVVRLRGTAYPRGTPPKGFPLPPEIVNGAALTRGVDREWMEQWMKQNHLNPLVVNHLVFVHASDDGIRGATAEFASLGSGLEPVDPDGDRRIPAPTRSEVDPIKPGVRP